MWTMIAAQLTPVSALKDWVPMQDIRYYLHFDLKKVYFVGSFGSLPGPLCLFV